jgi:hypothetical protein
MANGLFPASQSDLIHTHTHEHLPRTATNRHKGPPRFAVIVKSKTNERRVGMVPNTILSGAFLVFDSRLFTARILNRLTIWPG